MKLAKSQLKQLIKEEIQNVLNEQAGPELPPHAQERYRQEQERRRQEQGRRQSSEAWRKTPDAAATVRDLDILQDNIKKEIGIAAQNIVQNLLQAFGKYPGGG